MTLQATAGTGQLKFADAATMNMRRSMMVRIPFRTTGTAPTSTNNRLFAANSTASGTRGWGMRIHSGAAAALLLNWFSGGTEQAGNARMLINRPTDGDGTSGHETYLPITTNTQYDLLICLVVTASPAVAAIKMFLNGAELYFDSGSGNTSTPATTLASVLTNIPDLADVVMALGRDAKGGNNAGPAIFGELEIVEAGFTAATDFQALATSLYNSGKLRRLQEHGYTPVNYFHLFTLDTTGPIADSIGTETLTLANITAPSSDVCEHFDMYEPIIDADVEFAVYDATSGGSAVANNGAVARWEDRSGRKLHLVQGTANDRTKLRSGSLDLRRSVFFDKFPDAANGDTESASFFNLSGIRLKNTRCTIAIVADHAGFKNEYNNTTANDRTFSTLWSHDNAGNGRVVFGRETNGSYAAWSTGMFRVESGAGTVAINSGGSATDPSTYLYCPSSPSLIVYVADSAATNKQGMFVNDFSAHNARRTTSAPTAANSTAGGNFTLGYNANPSGGLAKWNYHGGMYRFRYWSRPLANLDAASIVDAPSAELVAWRDALDAAGVIVKMPTHLDFFDGSSSMEGQAAVYGRNIPYQLRARVPGMRRSWQYNIGCKRSRLHQDTTDGAMKIPSRDNHAAHTIDIVAGRFTTIPRRLIAQQAINDINSDGRTGAQALANLKTYLTNRKTAFGGHAVGSGMYPLVLLLGVWDSIDTGGSDATNRAAYNAALLADSDRGTLWNAVQLFDTTPLINMAHTNADPYTSDDKHPNEDGFGLIAAAIATQPLVRGSRSSSNVGALLAMGVLG